QIDEGLSALLWAEGRELGKPDEQANQATVIMAKTGGDKAGVHGIGRDACAGKASGQFVGKQEISELGLAVGAPAAIALCPLRVGKVELGLAVRIRGDVHKARRRGGFEGVKE